MEELDFHDDPGFNDAAATLNQLLKVLQDPKEVTDRILNLDADLESPKFRSRRNAGNKRENRGSPSKLFDGRPGTSAGTMDMRPISAFREPARPGTSAGTMNMYLDTSPFHWDIRPGSGQRHRRPASGHKEVRIPWKSDGLTGNSMSLPSLDAHSTSPTHAREKQLLPQRLQSPARRRQVIQVQGRPDSQQDPRLLKSSSLPDVSRPLTASSDSAKVRAVPPQHSAENAANVGVRPLISPPPLLCQAEQDSELWWSMSPQSIDESFENLSEEHEKELKKVRAELEDEISLLKARHAEELERLRDAHIDELRHLKDAHLDELDRVWQERTRLVEAHDEECQRKEAANRALQEKLHRQAERYHEERDQLRSMLQSRDEELAQVRSQQCSQLVPDMGSTSHEFMKVFEPDEDRAALKSQLEAKCWELRRVESQLEKEGDDHIDFVKRISLSSAGPALEDHFDMRNSEFIGVGSYGYVMAARQRLTGRKVVLKLQTEQWASVAVREWALGAKAGTHEHIVEYLDAIMHSDSNGHIREKLQRAYDSHAITGKAPAKFPDCYFCLALEFMDRGTAQSLIDKDLIGVVDIAAITRQVGLALAYMHKLKQTHNDIKPENILLCQDRRGKNLVAKLADLGLACHSLDRARDCDLFGYTVWCMGLKEKFKTVPSSSERRQELGKFRAREPRARRDRAVWQVLAGVIDDMWSGCTEMHEIAEMPGLKGYEVHVPDSSVKYLEEFSRKSVVRRVSIKHQVLQGASTRNDFGRLPTVLEEEDEDELSLTEEEDNRR